MSIKLDIVVKKRLKYLEEFKSEVEKFPFFKKVDLSLILKELYTDNIHKLMMFSPQKNEIEILNIIRDESFFIELLLEINGMKLMSLDMMFEKLNLEDNLKKKYSTDSTGTLLITNKSDALMYCEYLINTIYIQIKTIKETYTEKYKVKSQYTDINEILFREKVHFTKCTQLLNFSKLLKSSKTKTLKIINKKIKECKLSIQD